MRSLPGWHGECTTPLARDERADEGRKTMDLSFWLWLLGLLPPEEAAMRGFTWSEPK